MDTLSSNSATKSGELPPPSQKDTVDATKVDSETPNPELLVPTVPEPDVPEVIDPSPTPPTIEDAEPEPTNNDKKSKKKKKKGKAASGLNTEDAVVAEEDSSVSPAKVEPEVREEATLKAEPAQEAKSAVDTVSDEAHEEKEVVPIAQEEPEAQRSSHGIVKAEPSMVEETPAEPTSTPKELNSAALVAAQQRIAALEAEITELAHNQEKAASLEHDHAERGKRIQELERDLSRLAEVEELAVKREDEVTTLTQQLDEAKENASTEGSRLKEEVTRLNKEVEERLERQRERERGLEMEVNRLKQVRSSLPRSLTRTDWWPTGTSRGRLSTRLLRGRADSHKGPTLRSSERKGAIGGSTWIIANCS